MDPNIAAFAQLLYRNDTAALADLQLALDDRRRPRRSSIIAPYQSLQMQ